MVDDFVEESGHKNGDLSPENKKSLIEFYSVLRSYKRIKKGISKTEFITDDEIYLLTEENKRKRRICGRKVYGLPHPLFLCLNTAGSGTQHLGIGACQHHEFSGDKALVQKRLNNLWAMMNTEAGVPSNLADMIEHAKQIDRKFLEVIDPDIRILYALLGCIVGKGLNDEDTISPRNISQATKIIDKIVKAKYLRKQLEKETKLDVTTVSLFVREIFDIIKKFTPEMTAQQILTNVLEKVIKPYKEQNKIVTNAEYEIEDAVIKEFKEIVPGLGDRDG